MVKLCKHMPFGVCASWARIYFAGESAPVFFKRAYYGYAYTHDTLCVVLSQSWFFISARTSYQRGYQVAKRTPLSSLPKQPRTPLSFTKMDSRVLFEI